MKFTTSTGKTWYLHYKIMKDWGRGKITFKSYYFSKTKGENACEIPVGYKTYESIKGMPMLKKI